MPLEVPIVVALLTVPLEIPLVVFKDMTDSAQSAFHIIAGKHEAVCSVV